MFLAKLLGTLNDVVGGALAPCIDMAGCKLLAKARGTTRLDDIDYVVARCE